jgi:hypothetical protein
MAEEEEEAVVVVEEELGKAARLQAIGVVVDMVAEAVVASVQGHNGA